MSVKPPQGVSSFTRPNLTSQDYLELLGADPKAYCKIAQPNECRKAPSKELEEECSKLFKSCMEFAKQLDFWHRAN